MTSYSLKWARAQLHPGLWFGSEEKYSAIAVSPYLTGSDSECNSLMAPEFLGMGTQAAEEAGH